MEQACQKETDSLLTWRLPYSYIKIHSVILEFTTYIPLLFVLNIKTPYLKSTAIIIIKIEPLLAEIIASLPKYLHFYIWNLLDRRQVNFMHRRVGDKK